VLLGFKVGIKTEFTLLCVTWLQHRSQWYDLFLFLQVLVHEEQKKKSKDADMKYSTFSCRQGILICFVLCLFVSMY